MADYSVGVYDIDPYFTFSRTIGGSIVYSGPAHSEATATITDNGSGIDGLTLEDDTSGESATVTISINGNTSSAVGVSAEESWTLTDTTTGQTFQMVTFHVESGPAAGYYTITEQPLVVGHTYQTDTFESSPDAGAGDAVFTFGDYVPDQPDGIVSGTSGDDVINGSYTGDPQGEVVDGADSIGTPASDLEFNWNSLGGNGTNLTGGSGVDTGGIQVDVSYTDDGGGTGFSVNTSTSQYVNTGGGESFNTNSSGYLSGSGLGDTSTTRFDFSAVGGSGLQDEVQNVSFRINDIDMNGWQDIVTVTAFDANGVAVAVSLTPAGNDTVVGNTITAGNSADNPNQANGSVLVEVDGPVSYIIVDYDNGDTSGQALYITDVHFQGVPVGANSDVIEAGAGNDSIDSGLDSDTVYGGTGNDTIAASLDDDTLYGGDGADEFILGDGQGSDSIVGGEGGTDNDVVDASALTSGATVTFSGNEAGTLTDGADTATFSQIETLILTAQGDTVNGAASNSAMTIDAGAGADSVLGGSGNDVLDGGSGNDTVTGGAGADVVSGGSGGDTLNGGTGADTIFGGSDADTIVLEDGFGNDTISGGETGTDTDTLDASSMTSGVNVMFTASEQGTINNGADTALFEQMEVLVLSDYFDTVDGTSSSGPISVDGGGGNDSILGGAGNDSLTGGSGADTLNGGAGNDTIYGGDDADTVSISDGGGSDSIIGGEGGSDSDLIDLSSVTTAGVTVTYSGDEQGTLGNGDISAGFSQMERLILSDLADTVYGGADSAGLSIDAGGGNDTITGGSGGDTLTGGSGADSLDGGDGVDTLIGGTGSDTLVLGAGDTASGGDGDDTFTIDSSQTGSGTITITGGEGNETLGDTLDFNGQLLKGSKVITNADDNAGGLTGYAFLTDGTRVEFTEIEKIICFARGTMILTHKGEKPIEALSVDDQILTLDHGLQQIRWIGSRKVPAIGDFAPITIAKGVLGNHSDLTVSPQHRMLVSGPVAELLFGEKEVLIPAKHLLSWDGVFRVQMAEVEYFHMLFDTHQLVHANGAPSESFHPGEEALDAVSAQARDEILALFPELADAPAAYGPAARFSLKGYEAEVLGQRMA